MGAFSPDWSQKDRPVVTEDKIVYKVYNNDDLVFATFSKQEAFNYRDENIKKGNIEKEIIDVSARKEEATKKLDAVDKLVLELQKPATVYRQRRSTETTEIDRESRLDLENESEFQREVNVRQQIKDLERGS